MITFWLINPIYCLDRCLQRSLENLLRIFRVVLLFNLHSLFIVLIPVFSTATFDILSHPVDCVKHFFQLFYFFVERCSFSSAPQHSISYHTQLSVSSTFSTFLFLSKRCLVCQRRNVWYNSISGCLCQALFSTFFIFCRTLLFPSAPQHSISYHTWYTVSTLFFYFFSPLLSTKQLHQEYTFNIFLYEIWNNS